MLFSYTAKLKTGEIFEGTMESTDRFALSRDLRARGDTPLSITPAKSSALNNILNLGSRFRRVKASELVILTKNLSGMLRAGLSLSRSLSVLKKQTKNSLLSEILVSLSNDIDSGETFSSALAKFPRVFSPLFVSMIRAGEDSGNLSGALSQVGASLEKTHALVKKIHGALMYPGVILSAMVVIGVLMFAFVVPTLAGTFKELGVQLPFSTKVLIFIGTFISSHLLLTFALLGGIAAGIYYLFRAPFMARYIDFTLLTLPVFGKMAREMNTARTARTLSSLLSSGVSLLRAIEVTEDVVQNVYFKEVLAKAKNVVEKGTPFSEVFKAHTNLYPVMMSEMIQVGEETGKLSDMLLQIATFYEEEIDNKTKNLSTIIEPILMVLIGSGVGFFAISMISPLYSILGEIQ